MHTLSWKDKKGEHRKQPLQQYPPLNTAGLNLYATDQKNRPARKNNDNRSTLDKSDTSLRPPSTRIWIFLNPQIFLSGFKNFHVHTQRIQTELSLPQVREITLISSAGLKSDLRLMRYFPHHSSAKKRKKKTFLLTKLSHQALIRSFNYFIGVQFVRPTSKAAENVRATAWHN